MRLYFIHGHERQKEVILFIHIDKTAGQTLTKIIEDQYHISEVYKLKKPFTLETLLNEISKAKASKIGCYFEHLEAYLNQVPKGDTNINCIYGHIYFGAHRFLNKPYTYITMLREPIDRVISHYYYLQGKNHFKTNTSFEDFISDNLNRNVQTQYISGQFTPKDTPDIQKAKENIDKYFSIVGITEMFDESLFLMKKQFGWQDINYSKKNVTVNRPSRDQLSKEIIDLVKRHNELDIELYDYARNMLEQKIHTLDDQSKQELHFFIQNQQNQTH
ncbi:Sulfotransferase family protein [Paenibacillus sp. yr247]|uniref:sulfotransferase family 2 domain-containing protein n=1 Tax=Paenibacillus sp. yr247 TaxID=1761880 RepID=UPI000882F0E0|nr:sulfotransferase family 2 domain-containing protein [Paenibacillus sp. yr247]SDN60276.1 Sulfotransferase family protein [Paenibacillus sp. yr247]